MAARFRETVSTLPRGCHRVSKVAEFAEDAHQVIRNRLEIEAISLASLGKLIGGVAVVVTSARLHSLFRIVREEKPLGLLVG